MAKSNEPGATSVTIYMRGGEHQLLPPPSSPADPAVNFTFAEFGANHAPVTVKAYGGEQPILHGAVTFSPTGTTAPDVGYWTQYSTTVYDGGTGYGYSPASVTLKTVTLWKFVFTGAKKAELAERISGLKNASINKGKFSITEVYLENERLTRSRHPNFKVFNADTSPFEASLPEQQQNAVIVDPKWVASNSAYRAIVTNGSTELVFTRSFQEPRALITGATVLSDSRVFLKLAHMRNDLVGGQWQYPYEMGSTGLGLAEVKPEVNLPDGRDYWDKGRMENNLLFLDYPGEWFFHVESEDPSQGEISLHYHPRTGETLSSLNEKTFYLPFSYTLIGINGNPSTRASLTAPQGVITPADILSDISLEGLEMKYTSWKYENGRGNSDFHNFVQACYGLSGVVDGNNVDNVRIQDCYIHDFGLNAIAFGGNRRAFFGIKSNNEYFAHARSLVTNLTIDGNTIQRGGGGGIRIDHYPYIYPDRGTDPSDGTPQLTAYYDHNKILNNSVQYTGTVFSSSIGIVVGKGFNTLVQGNGVRYTPYTGIHVNAGCWRSKEERLQILANEVQDTMQRLIDGGGIYTFGGYKILIRDNTVANNGTSRRPDAIDLPPTFQLSDGTVVAWSDIYLDWMSYLFTVTNNQIVPGVTNYTRKVKRRTAYHNISTSGPNVYVENHTQAVILDKCPDRDEDCCGHYYVP